MPTPIQKKSLWQRQIPTIIGLTILVIALVGGLLVFGQGTGVFAPRATPETTPKNIKLTNVSDSSFTVSFLTDGSTPGFVKYGEAADSLSSQASDDRDQLSGSVGSFTLHHITVRGLQPGTNYFYTIGTGTSAQFDNQGSPFSITTAKKGGAPAAAKTIYGTVLSESGGPAEGSVVYVSVAGVGEMSSLVKGSGSWAIPLSNARTADGSGYASITDDSTLNINVQGAKSSQTATLTTTVAQSQPVPAITFGQETVATPPETTSVEDTTDDTVAMDSLADDTGDTVDDVLDDTDLMDTESTSSAELGGTTASESASTAATDSETETDSETDDPNTTIDLKKTTHQTVSTGQPTIKGQAAPNISITIKVNSETQITQQLTTDSSGNFVLDISQLEQELEPGEHSVEYSYVDPTTNQTVTKTHTFTVSGATSQGGTSTLLAQANTSTTGTSSASSRTVPFGSGNPFPIGGATTSASASPSATASPSARVTNPSTESGIPKSGVVQTTYALIFGGIFFIVAGLWSFWLSQQLAEERIRNQE